MQSKLSEPTEEFEPLADLEPDDEPAPPPGRRWAVLFTRAMLVNVTIGALVVAGGIWAYQTVWGASTATAAAPAASRRAVARVTNVVQSVSSSGSVASSNVVAANFTTNGTVTAIYVKLGDRVTKGQVLARIDPTSVNQQLKTARDNVTAAEDSLARAKTAADTTAIDAAQQQVDQADDALIQAQAAVNGVVLKAPIAGTVIGQNGTVGASSTSTGASGGGNGSSSATGFVQIADLTKMEIDTSVAEADATKLEVGMAADVTWNALTGATATGKVASIDPTATTSNNVVSYGVVVTLASLPKGIRIGQSTTVVVTTAEKDDVLAVPSTAVTTAGGFSVVTKFGETTPTRVEIGLVGDSLTEITSGLNEGDAVTLPQVSTTGTTTGGFGGGGFGGGGLGGGFGGGFGGGAGTGTGRTGGTGTGGRG